MKRLPYAIQRWALAPSVSSASALHRTMLTVCSHLSVIESLQVATYLRHNASEAGCVCVCALWHMSWSVSLVLDQSSSTTEHCTCEWKGQHHMARSIHSYVTLCAYVPPLYCRDLNHKNIVRLFGVVCFTPPYYMAIELPANGDLKSFLLACQDPTKSTV